MKLITYLEKKLEKVVGKVDIDNGEYNIKIKYTPIGEKEKKISFTIATNANVQDLSEIINRKDSNLSISANDSSYKKNKKLYDIFLADDPEFNVFYDSESKTYRVRIINVIDKFKGFFTTK